MRPDITDLQDALDGMERHGRGVAHLLMSLSESASGGEVTPPGSLDVLAETLWRSLDALERARSALDALGQSRTATETGGTEE